jgi:hypothetical protein
MNDEFSSRSPPSTGTRAWAEQQKDRRSRSEAIRHLIEIALTGKTKRQSSRGEK